MRCSEPPELRRSMPASAAERLRPPEPPPPWCWRMSMKDTPDPREPNRCSSPRASFKPNPLPLRDMPCSAHEAE